MPHDATKSNTAKNTEKITEKFTATNITATNITDAELAVLDALWSEGTATIRRIADLVYPSGTAAHYATVQKLLERLEAKGCVGRNRGGFAHVFTAAVVREDVIAQRLRAVAEQLCEGSMTPLLLQLVHGARLSGDERAALQKLIDESDDAPASRTSTNRKGRRDA